MQKKTRKASILIWSIFLSLIISITFISISTKINKNIRNNDDLKNQINTSNEIKNIINSGSISGINVNQTLENGEELVFESLSPLQSSLKKGQIKYIQFPISSNITITLSHSGGLFYSTTGNITSSGVINNLGNINAFSGVLELSNLGGYMEFDLQADQGFLPQYSKYKIIKKIGNKEVIKQQGEIKNF